MRLKTKPVEGGHLWRMSRWTPPDPVWVATGHVEAVRSALREYDPLLNLWWSPMRGASRTPDLPGRWRVVRWVPSQGNHTTVFFWEGEGGTYRGLDGSVTAMVDRLRRCDRPIEDVEAEINASTEEAERAQKRDQENFREDIKKHWEDYDARDHGVRQTFGPGYIRRRTVKHSDIEATNHKRAVNARVSGS